MADPYGLKRVLEPRGSMPQPAWKLDNTMVCGEDELLVDVDVLTIDAASFAQIKGAVGADADKVRQKMLEIVALRGKHHNPATGSGGMLIGRVAEIGPEFSRKQDLRIGDRIATLVSLSLTPLKLTGIQHVDLATAQVQATGQAILFDSGLYVKMPDDLPDRVTLAVCDVCGAPAQTARLVQPGQVVAVLGAGGKAGSLVLAQARRNLGTSGRLVALEYAEKSAAEIGALGYADEIIVTDARNPVQTLELFKAKQAGALADLTVNCVNVPGTELASILVTKERGLIYFFGMATSFTTAALGAEGVGKDVDMMIGNGYARGHAELALGLVRSDPALLEFFSRK